MIKRRVRITEEETRYFLVQLLEACRYMHDNRVIHRDIKLSNIFLDKNMDPKLGDFGLAALLLSSQDRKKYGSFIYSLIASPNLALGPSAAHRTISHPRFYFPRKVMITRSIYGRSA